MMNLLIKYKEVLMYLIFGVLTTLVNIFTYYVCTKILLIDYQVSNIFGWVISVTFAYITNKIFVFESKKTTIKDITKEAASFYSCRLVSLGSDIVVMYIMVSLFLINDMFSKIVSNILVIILNYFLSKFVIFRKKSN